MYCLRIFLLLFVFTFTYLSQEVQAQNNAHTFLLSFEDIQTANLQNLEEAMAIIPFFNRYTEQGNTVITYGTIGIQTIAIYKDGFPVALDQNINYNLKTIPLWDIERIEVRLTPMNTSSKNSSITIHMFSHKIPKKPIWSNVNVTNTSLNDLHSSVSVGLSNVKHSGQIGLSRSFTRELYDQTGLRSTVIGAFERYDINLKYTYKILPGITLHVQSDHSSMKTQNKGDIILGTSRVSDSHQDFKKNNLWGYLQLKASKNHTIQLDGMIHRFNNDVKDIDKDLHTGQQTTSENFDRIPSIGYDQGLIKLSISSQSKPLQYTFGIELSHTRDNKYPFINAVSTSYNDYDAFGLISYQYKKTVLLSGGINLWHNNLSGSYLLPKFQIKIAPKKVLELNFTSHSSVSYAPFTQLFYPSFLNNGSNNNILLKPIKKQVNHAHISFHQGNIWVNSGMLLINQNNIPQVGNNKTLISKGKTSNFTTYATMQFSLNNITIRPSAMMHAVNHLRDSGNLTFFYPELNLNAFIKIPHTKMAFGITSKFLGKMTKSFIVDNEIYLSEQKRIRYVSLRLQRSFMDNKFNISLGLNNVFQSSFLSNDIFQLNDIDKTRIGNQNIICGYPKSFTIKLSYSSF